MPSRRSSIAMTPTEEDEYLRNGFTLQIASYGARPFPHLVAMWYEVIDGLIHFTTYGKSQKVQNLKRNPHITAMLESGKIYSELKGLCIEGLGEIIEDPTETFRVMRIVNAKYGNPQPADDSAPRTTKRVVVRIRPVHTFSWDHTKLGGVH